MLIERNSYLQKLIKRRDNGMIKVITGLRRAGKSFMLSHIYHDYLRSEGVDEENIITVDLDNIENLELRDGLKLYRYVKSLIKDKSKRYYLFLDEVQFASNFTDVINGLGHIDNLDIYVTGSNSRFLSSDILTEFRGRGDEIRIYPLSFSEYYAAKGMSQQEAWKEYYTYGGLPQILERPDYEMKASFLNNLFSKVYLSDICERNNIHHSDALDRIVDVLASSIGSLTNPTKLSNTFNSLGVSGIDVKTIRSYMDYLADSFLLSKAKRYDVKGKRYIDSPFKYYFTDLGLRNARLNFRQQEENHIMENVIYNELLYRDFSVDVGVVETRELDENGQRRQKQLEIDFIANKASRRYYIQSAFEMGAPEKIAQEKKSMLKVSDSFKKIIVVKDDIMPYHDDNGISVIGLFDFLLTPTSLDL